MGLFGNIVSRKLINTLASAATDALGDALTEKLSDNGQQSTASSSPAYQPQTLGFDASFVEEQPKILTSKEIAATVSGNPYAPGPEDGIKLIVDSGKDKRFCFDLWCLLQNFDWDISWGDGVNEHKFGETIGILEHEYPHASTNYLVTIKPHTRSLPGKNEKGWFQPFRCNTSLAREVGSILFVDGIIDDYAINPSVPGSCFSMFIACDNLRMGPNFNFSFTRNDMSPDFASHMFASCSGDGFTINDTFTFPQVSRESLIMSESSPFCPFWGIFAYVTAKQKRKAVDIIGVTMNSYGSAAPNKPCQVFSEAFDTTGVLNQNWYSEEAWQPTLS
jgi:hypothetical protein